MIDPARQLSVAIFGDGVAALTAAHELGQRGFRVLVVEPPRLDRALPADSADDAPLLLPVPCRHLLDTMSRIPVEAKPDGAPRQLSDELTPTNFSALSHAARTAFVFSPSRAASTWERYERFRELLAKLSPLDVQTLFLRMLRYHTTSSERRRKDCESISFLDYLEGRDASALPPYRLSETVVTRLTAELKTIAGLDSSWCDARSILSMLVQFHLGARSDATSGFLQVPRSTWQQAWRQHLDSLGVEFRVGTLSALRPDPDGKLGPEVDWQGSSPADDHFPCDYQIVATDVVSAERVSQPLEVESGVPGELQGFTTVLRANPRAPERSRYVGRDPSVPRNVGVKEWDRLRFEMSILLELPRALPVLEGHLCHVESPWALETTGWIRADDPSVAESGKTFVGVTIHDVRVPATVGERQGKSACECTPAELASETWAQLQQSLKSTETDALEPASFRIGDSVEFANDKAALCRSSLVVPIIGDWQNRPGGDPWLPSTPGAMREGLATDVWQAPHGGYWVHAGGVVFAGAYLRTFTRIFNLEAENESARHAVNAILAHASRDTAKSEGLAGAVPDYCPIWDPEAAEPPEFEWMKELDRKFFEKGMSHAWDSLGIELLPRLMSQRAPARDPIPDVLSILGEMGRTSGQADRERTSEASPIIDGLRAIRQGLEEQIAKMTRPDPATGGSTKEPPA